MGGTGTAGAAVWRTRRASGVYTNEEYHPAEPFPTQSESEEGQSYGSNQHTNDALIKILRLTFKSRIL